MESDSMTARNKARKRHTREFKLEAVRQMELRGSRTVKEVADSLGVAPNMLHAWRKELGDAVTQVMADRGESMEDELQRLRRENQQLKQDTDTLKKSIALFLRGK
ncbi:MAG TPA: transposase [Polyangiaceae bacterium]|nr:transposase [Polyangiaceae bacterium]